MYNTSLCMIHTYVHTSVSVLDIETFLSFKTARKDEGNRVPYLSGSEFLLYSTPLVTYL